MKNFFKYQGMVSSFGFNSKGCSTADLVLGDIEDWDKAPTRIQAFGALAKYIDDIEGTDAEERYIQSDWYYDTNLFLHRIEVPSGNQHIPAKVLHRLTFSPMSWRSSGRKSTSRQTSQRP